MNSQLLRCLLMALPGFLTCVFDSELKAREAGQTGPLEELKGYARAFAEMNAPKPPE